MRSSHSSALRPSVWTSSSFDRLPTSNASHASCSRMSSVGRAQRGALSFTYSARHLHELNLSDATRVLQLNARWADELWKTMQPFSSGGVYVNYLGDEGEDRVKAGYGTNYQRLVALKNKYDPTNLFRFNQNIVPTRKNSSSGTA
jgi:FAD/FMN-containing dehydrogenase